MGVIEALQEREQTALTGTAGPHDRGLASHGNLERHTLEHGRSLSGQSQFTGGERLEIMGAQGFGQNLLGFGPMRRFGVTEGDALKLESECSLGCGCSFCGHNIGLGFAWQRNDFLDPTERSQRLVDRGDCPKSLAEGHDHHEEEQNECHQVGDRE